MHAWRHEEWAALDADSEAALLHRATDAMRRSASLRAAFDHPAGGLTERTLALLGEHGYRYVSPAGKREGLLDGLAMLPFRWPLVDAYFYLPQFAGLRERYGDGPDPLTSENMLDEMIAALRSPYGSQRSSHPALPPLLRRLHRRPRLGCARPCLGETARLAESGRSQLCAWTRRPHTCSSHPEELAHPPQLDDATWMTS